MELTRKSFIKCYVPQSRVHERRGWEWTGQTVGWLQTVHDVYLVPSNLPFLLHLAPTRNLNTPHVAQAFIIKLSEAAAPDTLSEKPIENHLAWCHGIQEVTQVAQVTVLFSLKFVNIVSEDANLLIGRHLL